MPLDLTDDQLAALRSILSEAPTPEVIDLPASTSTTDVAPAPTSTDVAPTPAPTSAAVKAGDFVSQSTTLGWLHKPATRYGLVVRVDDDTVIVGTDVKSGDDITATHVEVAWFGADGLTTVPLDELTPIA